MLFAPVVAWSSPTAKSAELRPSTVWFEAGLAKWKVCSIEPTVKSFGLEAIIAVKLPTVTPGELCRAW